MSALARAVVSLYPAPWRERYGEEVAALLEESGVGPAALVDLLKGVLVAYLRHPLAWAIVWWGIFALAGLGFYKTTENYSATGHAHEMLGASHTAVQALAAIAAVASGVSVWLLWRSASRADGAAARRRRPALAVTVALLSLGMVAMAAAVGVYLVALLADAGALAAAPNGPGGLVSVGFSLAVQLGVMAIAAGLAARACRRGWSGLAGG